MVPTSPLMPAALALLLGTLPALAETPPAPPIAVTTTEQAQDTPPPAPCLGTEAIAAGKDRLLKRADMAKQGLITGQNLMSENIEMANQVAAAIQKNGYDAACYTDTLKAARDLQTAQGEEAKGADYPVTKVIEAIAASCKGGNFEKLSACLEDQDQMAKYGLIDERQRTTLIVGTDYETADLTEDEIEKLLTQVKAQVEAGTLTESQQGFIVEKLLK